MQRYYKTDKPEALAAQQAFIEQSEALGSSADAFAEKWGGKALLSFSIHGIRFGGLKFSPAKTDALWTKPDARSSGEQRPRASLAKSTPEQRQALKALNTEWREGRPKIKADRDPVLQAAGTDWGALMFSGAGLKHFVHDGNFFMMTGLKLDLTEITASEFEAAEKSAKAVPP